VSAPCPVLGFRVRISVDSTADRTRSDAVERELIALLGSRGLVAASRRPPLEIDVTREGGQATEVDRQLVLDWVARSRPGVEVAVSDLTDLNPMA
jgi:hypothetical protein